MLNHAGHVTLTSWIFFQIFTSGRSHRDMKILKILASNPKGSDFMAFLKTDKLMTEERLGQIQHFLR